MARRYTDKLLELIEDGTLDAKDVARCALGAMSEAEVQSMCEDDFEIVGRELGDNDDDEDDETVPDPAPVDAVLSLLEDLSYTCFAPGKYPDHIDCEWPLVRLTTRADGNRTEAIMEVDALLAPIGWELVDVLECEVSDNGRRCVSLWTIAPLNR
jgi:hypothetical protein